MGDAAGAGVTSWGREPVRCVACGAPLGRLDSAAGRHCRTLACRTVVAIRSNTERDRLRVERDEAAATAHFAGRDVVAIRLPAMTRSLVSPDPRRVADFASTLSAAMADAVARRADPDGEPIPAEGGTGGAMFQTACTTCGGDCCRHGGTHAFLTADLLAARLAREPGRSPDDMVAAYLDRLPAQSFEGSCVFHGEAGCRLDRAHRSDVCNDYMCEGLRSLTMHLMGDRPLAFAAVEDGHVVRAAVMADDRLPVEPPPV